MTESILEEEQRLEIEKEKKLWCRIIVAAQIYLVLIALASVHYLFDPFHLPHQTILIITGVFCGVLTILLMALCIFFCRPSPEEIIRPLPVRRLTAASIETDPAFFVGGTVSP